MPQFTRQSLYDLVWSEPMQSLAKRFGLSDRGLAKICASANIPVPPRGYWAKLQAGKKIARYGLPARGLGQSDMVHFGGGSWSRGAEADAEILREPIPPPPVFEPDMETVRTQAAALVRKAPLPLRDSHGWHSQVARLLAADEERARKQKASPYPSPWDGPIFNTAFEQRRLHILNALFICLTRCGMTPSLSGKHGRELHVTVGNTSVSLLLDATGATKLIERERQGFPFVPRGDKDKIRLSFSRWWSNDQGAPSWEDKPGERLERRLREVAVEIIVFAEQQLRDAAARLHAWRVERKAELQEEQRKREAEKERRRRERQARLEQARIDHLLGQAGALEQANQIRAYVAAVRAINDKSPEPMTAAELDAWAVWALAQADRIDPVISGAYKLRPKEPEGDNV